MAIEDSLKPVGETLMDMFNNFTGKTMKAMTKNMTIMNKNLMDARDEIEKTNELIEQDTLKVVEAIEGLSGKTLAQSLNLQGSLDQLVGSMVRMGGLSDEQSYLLEELKNSNIEAATQNKQDWENMVAAIELLSSSGINNDEMMENLRRLDGSLRDEKILRAIMGIGDGLEEERLKNDRDDARGGKTAPSMIPEKEEEGGFLDNIGTLLTGGLLSGGLKGIGGKLFGLVKKIGPWLIAISAAFDFFQGFTNAADIVGKKAEDLDMFDKVTAGLANVISGLTFGLVEAKDVYKFFSENMKEAFSTAIGYVVEILTLGFVSRDDAKKIAGEMYDDIVGGLRNFVNDFVGNFGKRAMQAWASLKDVLGSLPSAINATILWFKDLVVDIFSIRSFDDAVKVIDDIGKGFMSLFSPDGFLGKVLTFITTLLDFITGGASGEIFKKMADLGDKINNSVIGAIGDAADFVFGDKPAVKTQIQSARKVENSSSSQAIIASKKRFEESMVNQPTKLPNIVVNAPPASAPQDQPSRRRNLGNIGLTTVNSGAFD
jgi:hypothetical protein